MSSEKQPINIIEVEYDRDGESVRTNAMGMREMQQRAYEKRNANRLLIKAPPASGKSRALMFVGIDKLFNQNRKKIIVAVPERSIGASFETTNLKEHGFFADWEVDDKNNLCTPGAESGKVGALVAFMESPDPILICTHATLRSAFESLSPDKFNGCVLAIDEFHHVSSDVGSSRLGSLLRDVMYGSDVHIIAMTGSYFRGDAVPILSPEDEEKFTPVTFNYYDQLNGYEHLKSLGIGYHFYQGRYTSAIHEILDTDKKTIIHIPSPNSGESTKDKIEEVGVILDGIGTVIDQDDDTGIIHVKRASDGKIIKVADLVDDSDQIKRARTLAFLSQVAKKDIDAVDLIVALGMAKEGFDWPFCEHALTVGYRASLTEIIQIIGRCTRDSFNKEHAQFTNLIAEPEATTDEVKLSVNNMLKAITGSLLMEQVLAPNFKFKAKRPEDTDEPTPGVIRIKGFKEPSSDRVKQIIDTDLNDLKANVLQDESVIKASAGNLDPEVTNKVLIPKIIRERYPDLNDQQVEELRQQVVVDSVIKNGEIKPVGGRQFVKMADKFIKIDEINIDLIDKVNPFQKAFEVLSKAVTTQVLKVIQETIAATRIDVTEEEAELLWPKINLFYQVKGRKPDITSRDESEKRMAEVLAYLQRKKREQQSKEQGSV
jgi:superfamily II DNA or RNA helicase